MDPRAEEVYLVLELGSGERLLGRFQTPVLFCPGCLSVCDKGFWGLSAGLKTVEDAKDRHQTASKKNLKNTFQSFHHHILEGEGEELGP